MVSPFRARWSNIGRASTPELKATLPGVFKRDNPVLTEAPAGPMPPVSFKTQAQAQRPAWVSS